MSKQFESQKISCERGGVGLLALALFHCWEPDQLFVIISVYMDESGTHGAPLMIMSGYVGKLGQWADFDKRFRRLLRRYGLSHHHSKELRDTDGEYKEWNRSRKFAYTQELADIVEKHTLFGFSIMLRSDEYDTHYVNGYRPRRVPLDTQYGLCFRFALSFLLPHICEVLGRDDVVLNFILEEGHRNAGDAVRIFHEVKSSEPELAPKLGAIAFDGKRKFPGLQAADMVAYNAFRGEMRDPTGIIIDRIEGATIEDDRKATKSKSPTYRCDITQSELKAFKELVLNRVAERETRAAHTSHSSADGRPNAAAKEDS
jgi:hypothetical protein